jgi:MFS family permease
MSVRGAVALPADDFDRGWQRSVAFIAAGCCVASFSMNFWIPFLPILMQQLGAKSEAEAVFLTGIAYSCSGVARLITGPAWGILADRYGRKVMFVRALFSASVISLLAVLATEPWHIVVAYTLMGVFTGFGPAGVALASVIVPRNKLMGSLGTLQGVQYIGTTLGPAVGALLAVAFGMRGAILTGAVLPALIGLLVLTSVPRDRTAPAPAARQGGRRGGSLMSVLSLQFALGTLLYFIAFAMSQLVRASTPIAIDRLDGGHASTLASGAAFSVAGAASVVGSLGVARLVSRPGKLRLSLVALTGGAAAAFVLMSLAQTVPLYIVAFAAITLVQGATLPASNTVIAASVPAERRGTAFGFSGSAQALSFIVGPMGAALFTATSLQAGYLVLALALAAVAGTVFLLLREPDLGEPDAAHQSPSPADLPPRPPSARGKSETLTSPSGEAPLTS